MRDLSSHHLPQDETEREYVGSVAQARIHWRSGALIAAPLVGADRLGRTPGLGSFIDVQVGLLDIQVVGEWERYSKVTAVETVGAR